MITNQVWTEIAILNAITLTKDNDWIKENWGYVVGDKDKSLPFIDYILEDKSKYTKASDTINPTTNKPYVDLDNDFLIGHSGGFLMNIDYIFIDTHLFTEVADYYTKHGDYFLGDSNTIEYKKFWGRETHRRKAGMTAKCKLPFKHILEYFNPNTTIARKKQLIEDIHITGDHYSYLNYGRIERTANEKERKELDAQGLHAVNTIAGFPRFWDGDYWAYKVFKFTAINKFNNTIAKARRKGYSYKRGNQAANTLNLTSNLTIIFCADLLDYLTDDGALTDMAKKCLDWFETKTYWHRGYLSEAMDGIQLGYKLRSKGNIAFGNQSKLLSYAIGHNTSAAVGKKGISIDVDEAGKCPKLKEFIQVTMSNNESGALSVGGLNIWGTGGTKNSNWEHFEFIYYNPASISGISFENVWDDDRRHEVCGFFHPQIWNYEPYVEDGNSLLFTSFLKFGEAKTQAKKTKANDDFIIWCAQRANKPSEAFINTTENLFASPTLNIHVNDLKTDHTKKFYTDGWYVQDGGSTKFLNKDQCIANNVFTDGWHEFITSVPHTNATDIHGCVREYYPPYTNENGQVPRDLYFIVCDPYGVDKDRKEVTDKHSLYSFQVWMRDNAITPYGGKRIVAEYTGRLNTMKDNDKLLLLACYRWNCSVLPEINRGETVSNFKLWKVQDRLLLDPTGYDGSGIQLAKVNNYGMIVGDSDTKLNGLTMIKNFINETIGKSIDGEVITRLQDIYSLPLCLELQKYGLGNFDRISTMILAMYEFKKDEFIKRASLFKKQTNTTEKSFFKRISRK